MRFIPFLLLLGFSLQLFGQTYPSNPLDNSYTPPAGSMFDGTSSKSKSGGSGRVETGDKKNLISLNLPLAFRGIGAIGYERILADWFTVHGYLGVTFATDYFRFLGTAIQTDFGSGSSSLALNGTPINGGIKPFLQFGAKLFFESDPTEGDYLGLFYRRYQNNFKYEFSGGFEYNYWTKFNTYNLVYGRSKESNSGKMVHDYYMGVGYRSNIASDVTNTVDMNGNTVEVKETGKTSSAGNFLILISYTFSFLL